ncbi:RNA methyltransferase, TrmH family [Streptomyces sp. 2224.1]|uniref:RNA methyltransferase n=1 Tax=Streptomyces mooreae TaxID=3075523 RepID=A0ABU2TBQ3_9ACTN|nr:MULTISPECIES: RNA methyltransferase [unclassified Streptomyces]MDT0458368.1 RNA methyltransferase [Streptomyces sp. DSM 41527]PBC81422.1 TrmH family RNA methyltransferase [Streptomyces sp. 2321.6]SDR55097.1 RNA methyltransferase, TrmH family [Streptomyces sp. KS_16]SEC14591.1 RNA methyltransferase, TrmH family [Streptomyces sp. 2133.1]SED16490.1 RNA methyltransferase, TrmH family [Streptomyces sp. 2224.1]
MGTPELISPRSPRVTAARRLARRAFRGKERRFIAEGPQAVREAIAHRTGGVPTLTELFATVEAAERHTEIVEAARAAGVRVHFADDRTVADISQTVTPQGLLGVCGFLDSPFEEILAARPQLIAVLANVRDPGNAGTVLRCADAAGADAVVLTDASVDLYNPKSVRASVGSLFHLPVAVGVPVERVVSGLQAAGVRILAADGAGDRDLDAELDTGSMGGPTAWVFGNEAWGLPEETRALADAVVRVPIHGRAESLNLATAAAVCLYASARAQRSPGGCRAVSPA